jgi:ABC-type branched-subunit amino acid transport system substrate-binding protein
MHSKTFGRRWWRLATASAVALAASGIVAATGSSKSTSGDASAAKAAPVTVFFDGPIKTAVADETDAYAAVQSAALAINKSGGLGGHQVKLVLCNETSANTEVACARKAAATKALAFVGSSFFFNAAPVDQVLAKAKIPSIGPLAVVVPEFSSPINFPIDVPSLGVLACPQLMKQATGTKKISAITQDLPVQDQVLGTIRGIAGIDKLGYGTDVKVPVTETDYSSAAAQLGSNADTVINFLTPTVQGALFTAAASLGETFKTCASPAGFTVQVLKQLGSRAANIYEALGLPPVSSAASIPLVQQFKNQINAGAKAHIAGAGVNKLIVPANALRAWLSMQILEQVAPKVSGSLTGPKLLAALNKSTVRLPGIETLRFSKPGKGPGFERMFSPTVTLQKWSPQKGDFVTTNAKPVNMVGLFASLTPKS